MVLIFSADANESRQIRREVERAVSRSVTIVPVRIEQVEPTRALAYFMAGVHWLDALTPPLEQHLQRLAVSIKAFLKAAPGAASVDVPLAAPMPARADTLLEQQRPHPLGFSELLAARTKARVRMTPPPDGLLSITLAEDDLLESRFYGPPLFRPTLHAPPSLPDDSFGAETARASPRARASKSSPRGCPWPIAIFAFVAATIQFRHEIAAGVSAIVEFLRAKLSASPDGLQFSPAFPFPTVTQPSSRIGRQPGSDLVDVSAFAPEVGSAGAEVLVQVFLHRLHDAGIAERRARAADRDAVTRGIATLVTEIVRGKRVDILIEGRDFAIDEPLQSIVWRGEPSACQYFVTLPKSTPGGTPCNLRVRVFLDDFPVGSLRFTIKVSATPTEAAGSIAIRGDTASRYRYAFLSYATPDRPEVLKRVQVLRAAHVQFFQDLLSISPGEHWEQRLYEEIDRCDLFLLFWSKHAVRSEWVLREAERAVARQNASAAGEPDITPIILEGPPVPQPIPDSLKHLHFNDHLIFLIAAEERNRPTGDLPQ
jgi:hypothetical protein